MTEAPLVQSETVLQPLGRALITGIYATARALRFYPIENATVQNAIDELHKLFRRLLEREGTLELRLVGDFMFINESRLRLQLSEYVSFAYVANLFRRHEIGQLEFEPGFAREHIAPLLSLMIEGEGREQRMEDAFERFMDSFEKSTAKHVKVSPAKETGPDIDVAEDDAAKEAAKLTYFQSVHVAKEVLTDARMGRAVNLRRVKRTVQSIVDQVLNDETSLMGMTTLRDYDEYTFTHSVNVCIFSVMLGQKMGLTKLQLYELGLGALFHDIGKQRIDPDIINKTTGLTEDEWVILRRHPTDGLLSFFTMRGVHDVPYRAMLMAYEHHMKTDLSGYPTNKRPRHPTLFSRIVAAADGFDAATSKRSYQSQPWPPDEVMREMRDNPKRGYDPILVKAFIHATGVFPVGTVAILDTFEMAVVIARNPDPRKVHQPIAKIISDNMGMMLADPIVVDLSEIDPDTGENKRSIIKTVDADKYGIRVSDYFV
jgi:HD-GYP domain-containing protein (c-di-GMP phosphodiesterase class II)